MAKKSKTHADKIRKKETATPVSGEFEASKSFAPPPFQLMAEDSGHNRLGEEEDLEESAFKRKEKGKAVAPAVPSPVDDGENGGLPTQLRTNLEAMAGLDMSDVKVNYNSAKPAQLKALATAQGNEINLAPGQEKHLGHEAWHVVQQKKGQVTTNNQVKGQKINDDPQLEKDADVMGAKAMQMKAVEAKNTGQENRSLQNSPVQMLVKGDFPWTGVIVAKYNAALRSSPQKDASNPHENTLEDIPKGVNVTVIGHNGNWLEVKVKIKGKALKGYISQELVDDATAAKMQSFVGEEATWVPSGPGPAKNAFASWANAKTEAEAPELESSMTINCWEMILYSAYKAKAIDWDWIHNLYVNVGYDNWVDTMSGSTTEYQEGVSALERGALVFFDGTGHVALATGSGEDIYSFWPPPGKDSYIGTVDEVKVTTIKELVDYMTPIWGKPKVTTGPPNW